MKYRTSIILLLVFSSCYSYKVFQEDDRDIHFTGKKQLVYVVNPQLKKEYEIIRQADVFDFTDDSSNSGAIKLQLMPLRTRLACGQALFVSAFTLGQLPVYFPDRYFFEFSELNGKDTLQRQFELNVAKRLWFWDLFQFKKNFSKKAGQALSRSYSKATDKSKKALN